MSITKSRKSLERMLSYYLEIEEFTKGLTEADLRKDVKTLRAVTNNLIQIGELTSRVDDNIKACYPQVRWRGLKVFRNHLAHDYEGVSMARIWEISKVDLPFAASVLYQIYAQYASPKKAYKFKYKCKLDEKTPF